MQAFEFRSDERSAVVRAAVRQSVPRPSVGLLFLTGKLASQADLIADDLAASDLTTQWLIVCAVGVLSSHGEIEGESGAVGLRLPVRGDLVLEEQGDRHFGEALIAKLGASSGSTACVFVRGDATLDDWLVELRGAHRRLDSKIFGGGSLPGEPLRAVVSGRVLRGGIGAVVLPGRTVSQISASSACRLLSPLGEVTKSNREVIQEIDGMTALESLRHSAEGLEEGSLVLLAVAAGDRPLDPAGRSLALRPIVGVDPTKESVLLPEEIDQGARVAFAVRDAHGARTDLDAHLRALHQGIAGGAPGFGLYISCAGRGRALYKTPHVDTRLITNQFPGMPFVGMHSTFELAPLGDELTSHVYAGVLAVFSLPS